METQHIILFDAENMVICGNKTRALNRSAFNAFQHMWRCSLIFAFGTAYFWNKKKVLKDMLQKQGVSIQETTMFQKDAADNDLINCIHTFCNDLLDISTCNKKKIHFTIVSSDVDLLAKAIVPYGNMHQFTWDIMWMEDKVLGKRMNWVLDYKTIKIYTWTPRGVWFANCVRIHI